VRRPTAADVAAVLAGHRFTFAGEDDLQAAIASVLALAGLPAVREVDLGRYGRIDVLVDRVGGEVKVAGAVAEVGRQLQRYAHSPRVEELVLATTRARHRQLPARLAGTPLLVVPLAHLTSVANGAPAGAAAGGWSR
jgi:hypothetical protein